MAQIVGRGLALLGRAVRLEIDHSTMMRRKREIFCKRVLRGFSFLRCEHQEG